MRLEAVVVGDVADGAVLLARALRAVRSILVAAQSGFSTSTCLPLLKQVVEDFNLRLVGDAGEHRVVAGERHIFDRRDTRPRVLTGSTAATKSAPATRRRL